jgi:hypothetical protein
VKLKCQCCSFEREFADLEEAFQVGWDAPPHFTGYICCNLCPAVCIVGNLSHAKAHAYFQEHGRPTEFGANCLPDRDWGKWTKIQKQIQETEEAIKDLYERRKNPN